MVRSRGPSATPAIRLATLRNRVGHDADEAGALDRLGEHPLLQRRYRGDAGRHDLAALGNVALQQADVLVVDLGCVRTRKRAGLAAALERTARLGGGEIFDGHLGRFLELEPAWGARVTIATAEAAAIRTAARTIIVAVALLQHGRR